MLRVVPRGSPRLPELRERRRAPLRRGRFVVVRDAAERDLWEQRRRVRPGLASPAAVTRDIALALLEAEAGLVAAGRLIRRLKPRWHCGRFAFARTWDEKPACSSGSTSIVRMGRPEDDAA